MDLSYFVEQMKEFLQPLDFISILVTYLATQRFKTLVNKRYRPVLVFAVGLVIASAWAIYQGGWAKVPAYGMVYAGGASLLYSLWGRTVKGK